MKRFVRYNIKGDILSVIKSNDETLVLSGLIEIKNRELFRKIEVRPNDYKIDIETKKPIWLKEK